MNEELDVEDINKQTEKKDIENQYIGWLAAVVRAYRDWRRLKEDCKT